MIKSAPSLRDQIKEVVHQEGTVQSKVMLHGQPVDVRFRRATGNARTLIVAFHGAIDRERRPIPTFQIFPVGIEQHAHCLAIADPALSDREGFSMSWYIGHEDCLTQKNLPDLISGFSELLGCSRNIYFGTSGGGFAALYFSWHDSGSIAVVGNPQTDVAKYYEGHISRYLAGCWPGISGLDELPAEACTNIRPLYAERVPNTVIYLQNATDAFHRQRHMAPFFNDIPHKQAHNIILEVRTWGITGHRFSVNALSQWTAAATIAPDTEAETIRMYRVSEATTPGNLPAKSRGKRGTDYAEADLSFAERLKAIELGRTS